MASLPPWLAMLLVLAAVLAWPLLMGVLAVLGGVSAWRRRWRRAAFALLGLALMLGWSAGLPAWQRHRMQVALDMGPYQRGEPPDLKGSEVVLLGQVDSRRWDADCVQLLANVGVSHVWNAGAVAIVAPSARLAIDSELLPPGRGDDIDCKQRRLVMGEVPKPDWALVLPERQQVHFDAGPGAFDWMRAHFGRAWQAGLQWDYMVIPVSADGSLDLAGTVMAGFRGEVVYRPWWFNPLLPQQRMLLFPDPNPGREAFDRLVCGPEGECGI